MDPKNLPSLDPKLKEAYDRVMSTTLPQTPPAPQQPAPQAPAAQPATTAAAAPHAPTPPAAAQPTSVVTPTYTTLSAPEPASAHSTTFVAGSTTSTPSKSKISPVLLIILGVVFFAVYSLFWLRFFNVKLPFLP